MGNLIYPQREEVVSSEGQAAVGSGIRGQGRLRGPSHRTCPWEPEMLPTADWHPRSEHRGLMPSW